MYIPQKYKWNKDHISAKIYFDRFLAVWNTVWAPKTLPLYFEFLAKVVKQKKKKNFFFF